MLGHKVSRERIGTELDGMIKGPDPLMALDLLRTMGLFEAVFEVHPSADEDVPAALAAAGSALGKSACDMLSGWTDVFDGHEGLDLGSPDAKRQTILGALLLPLRHARVPYSKNKTQSMSAHVVRDSLKWKGKDADAIDLLHEVAPELAAAHAALLEGKEDAQLKVKLGRCVKRLRQMWPSGVFLSCLLCRDEAKPIGAAEAVEEAVSWEAEGAEVGGARGDRAMCEALESAIRRFGVHSCWQWKPLLNGKEVMSALGIAGGPALGAAMDACFDYQLVHPDCDRDEVLAWLKASWVDQGEGQRPLVVE
jgi:tRNA nucleotidyltransferase/poly(A) polymerase